MQNPKSSPSPPAQRASPITDTSRLVSRRATSPPAKRRRTSSPAYVSPSPSPPPSPSPEPQQPSPSPAPTPTLAKWFRKPSVVWYRGNDLRVEDHPALLAAAQRGGPVVPLFVWDPCDGFGADMGPIRQWWLKQSLACLQRDLQRLGVQLYTRTGQSAEELRKFLHDTGADAVFWNRCYEPDLLTRDEELRDELAGEGLTAESFKAELLVEPWELKNTEVSPCFETFHAYMRAWMTVPPPPQPFPCPSWLQAITENVKSTGIDALGFEIPDKINETMPGLWTPGSEQAKAQLDKFLREVFPAFGEGQCRRDFEGTSRLSPHIRFGELSPRRMYHSTRLRVSRWDQGSMLAIAPSARKLSSVRTNGGVIQDKSKPTVLLNETPENGTTAKRKREGLLITASSPPRRSTHVRGGDECEHNGGINDRLPSPPEREHKRLTQHQNRSSVVPRRPALPHISLSARAFLKNLCLRDFSYHVLFHNPDFDTRPLIPEFVNFPWAEDKGSFKAWQKGRTGYPIVDAAMRELRETGWIHNGMRFLLACFLTKYLLLPWSRGLKEFYGLLVDGDHSSNALGWQWTAGSNTDAFPVSCLVSPVKVGARQDPTGAYVRRWLPELAKLPNNFVHEPWKAPSELLKSAGIELGKTYPKRIVLMSEARTRAFEAMRVMKQIFSGSNTSVLRGIYQAKEDEWIRIREWPEEQHEVLQIDESVAISGKGSLLPSLWALLQGDQNSTYLSSSSSGSDPLIAMDTASLAEGALAVPMDDQHESIEHALIAPHAQGPPPEALSIAAEAVAVASGGRALGGPIYAQDKNCESQGMLVGNPSANGQAVGRLVEPLKYDDADIGTFAEPEKVSVRATPMDSDTTKICPETVRSMPLSRDTVHSGPVPSNINSFQGSTAQAFIPGAPYAHPPHQQIQQFQQFQQLQQFQMQQQHLHLQQQRHSQQSRQPQQQQHHPQQQQHRPQQAPPPHLHHPHSHTPPQQPAHAHTMMDGIYGHGSSNGSLPGTSLAGVPMAGAPVMMGPATGNQEMGVGVMFTGAEPGNAMYAHQFGVGQFYGFPPVMPVMNAHSVNGNGHGDSVGSSPTANVPKLGVQGMMPMPYGMYGGSVFDQNVVGNAFQSNGTRYGSTTASSQPQMHGGPQPQYGFPSHQMYFQPTTNEVPHIQETAHTPQPSPSRVPGQIHQAGMTAAAQARDATTAAAVAAVAAGERETRRHVASNSQSRSPAKTRRASEGLQSTPHSKDAQASASKRCVDAPKPPGSKTTVAVHTKPTQGRSSAKSSARSKTPARRKGSGSGGTGRNRADLKNSSRARGRGIEGRSSAAQQKGAADSIQPHGTTLKARQEILTSVLKKEDHEYHGFAKYLALTYELTASTDRHTSKDYIRLCNLKDDYHKQCESDRDKLKIYRIKNFFSQILKLEVTGEWDRHNHGGVRGPYVYGIRTRETADSSKHVTQN